MGKINSPRKGSLQFWPRKRASKFLPRVNWNSINNSGKNLEGFIVYKAGMKSAAVKDNTAHSMTKDKIKTVPVTILEAPTMKIFSVRFYKNGKVMKEVLSENLDKELKRKLKLPKTQKKIEEIKGDYQDLRVLCYSVVKKSELKKTPDLSEIAIGGNFEDKVKFVKENIGKEILISNIFEKGDLADFRGLTKGKGFQGPVKRFGITLKSHKSEKGQRRPGAIGSFHPGRTTIYAPMAGQLGMFSRISYNNKVIEVGKSGEKLKNIKNFGDIRTEYIVVTGSVQGPSKRQLLITSPLRETKKQKKKNYELVELR